MAELRYGLIACEHCKSTKACCMQGLEPEMQRMLSQHQAELQAAKQAAADASQERLQQAMMQACTPAASAAAPVQSKQHELAAFASAAHHHQWQMRKGMGTWAHQGSRGAAAAGAHVHACTADRAGLQRDAREIALREAWARDRDAALDREQSATSHRIHELCTRCSQLTVGPSRVL